MLFNYRVLFQRSVAFLGILNNTILGLLILYRSPKKLGNYKYLMMYISIFEIVYSLLDFSTVPEIFSKDSAFLIVIDKNSTILPDFFLIYAIVAFCSLFGMSMAIFAIHFVYRFLVITGSTFLQKHHPSKVIGLISFTMFIGIMWSIFSYAFFRPTIHADSILSQEYLISRHLDISEISYMGPLFHLPNGTGQYNTNWGAVGTIGLMTILIGLSFSTVFYCGYCIYQKMKSMSMLRSSIDTSLQSQLFWALVFQTLIPVVLMHIPASFGFLFSMFGVSIELLGKLPTITIFIYPALDPLPNFFIIKNYRHAILEFFGCSKRKPSPASSNESNPSRRVIIELQERVSTMEAN
ncbi:hypothetical protein CAEBREN_09547 [Caenorhabditis brenneri]|uniref:Serpentine receptor class r-10 n=1 Tax=Caenorhabditis brenneri TaxID=135651 RepID=G0ML98_CAEBE|nr:hypothetical protein CAEBREN_09547 [Caenorhabditis brenneri]